jgi:hypothetical protein
MSADFCAITLKDFKDLQSDVVDDRIHSIVEKITRDHECFAANYRYAPSKDQNYQNKMQAHFSKKPRPKKLVSTTDDNTKRCYALLNKLSSSNYKKIIISIKSLLKDSDVQIVGHFLEKLLEYSELSDLYLNAILDTIANICEDKENEKTFRDKFKSFHASYMYRMSLEYFDSKFKHSNYDDYDTFCDVKKHNKINLNMLNCLVQVSQKTDNSIDYIEMYVQNMRSVEHLLRENGEKNAMFIFTHFEHIELLLKETNILDEIGVDIQQFQLLCIEAMEETASKKLHFKIEDVSQLFEKKTP